jgi:hypothetical protein
MDAIIRRATYSSSHQSESRYQGGLSKMQVRLHLHDANGGDCVVKLLCAFRGGPWEAVDVWVGGGKLNSDGEHTTEVSLPYAVDTFALLVEPTTSQSIEAWIGSVQ